MCLILFSHQSHPEYKLIIAANRDEFYARPTSRAKFWDDHPYLLAGKDLEAGGTWMGINRKGEISMLTNYRDPGNIKPEASSRGHLVSDYLINEMDAKSYLSSISKEGNLYNGFNIICGTADQLFYYSNYQKGILEIQSGVYGLSNALLDTHWPKVLRGKQKLSELLKKGLIDPFEILAILYDDTLAELKDLPDTGVGVELEKLLSPIFIKSHGYGSRCSTVVLIDKNNRVKFVERTYNVEDFSYSDETFDFEID